MEGTNKGPFKDGRSLDRKITPATGELLQFLNNVVCYRFVTLRYSPTLIPAPQQPCCEVPGIFPENATRVPDHMAKKGHGPPGRLRDAGVAVGNGQLEPRGGTPRPGNSISNSKL